MGSRSACPKLLSSFLRRRNSAGPASIASAAQLHVKQSAVNAAGPSDRVIDIDDSSEIFSSVSTSKLMRSSAVLHMAALEGVVDFGLWVVNSRMMEYALLKKIVLESIEHSFFDHFCAGKDLAEVGRTVTRLWDSGLRAMLDYGLEHADDNQACDWNLGEFIRTIESARLLPDSHVSFIVVKITAICPPSLLRRVSDLLRWEFMDKTFNLPWKLKTFPIFSNSSPFYHTPNRPDPLNAEEESNLQLAHQRLVEICKRCLSANIPLLIDAEDTSIQPAIDYLAYSAAIEHGGDDERPLIFTTIQAYLKDSKERLVAAKKAADEMQAAVGFKLVRGAYMSGELRLASSLGVGSPIHDSLQQTHASYNECAAFMLHEISNGSGSVVLATHNLESGKLAASRAIDLGIKRDNPNLQFAQLYGMADTLSFGLRNAGFRVSKYLPFGPIEQIMPYLMRRAEENRGLLSTSSLDRQLMSKELWRRLTSSIC